MFERKSIVISPRLSAKLANMGFVGSCLVVGLHVSYQLTPGGNACEFVKFISQSCFGECAVPYFFISAGFFLAGHMETKVWWRRECLKRVKTLLVPYLFWNIFYWCFLWGLKCAIVLAGVRNDVDVDWLPKLGINPTSLPQHPYLWFIRSLMFAVFASPIFLVLRNKVAGSFCLIAYLLVFQCTSTLLTDGISERTCSFAINGWFRGLSCFAIGVYLRYNCPKMGRWRGLSSSWGGMSYVLHLPPFQDF